MVILGLLIFIAIGFGLLMYGGNLLVDGSVSVAKKMRVSSLLIGLTLVGFGTSTPELVSSLMAAIKGEPGIAIGNVVGSNIANILLVLGVAALLRPIPISLKEFRRDGLFLIASTVVLCAGLWWGSINFVWGVLMCGLLGYYVYYCYKTDSVAATEAEKTTKLKTHFDYREQKELLMQVLKTIAGIVLTVCGAYALVDSAVKLAHQWNVSPTIIGLTIVAVGTSLPELATSIVSSVKNQSSVAYGNVVGSNIYNALFVLGLTAVFHRIDVPTGKGDAVWIDVAIMAIVTAILLALGRRGRIGRLAGALFLFLYVIYVGYLYLR